MSRFVSKGRNSWAPRVERYRPHFDGKLQPMDQPRRSLIARILEMVK